MTPRLRSDPPSVTYPPAGLGLGRWLDATLGVYVPSRASPVAGRRSPADVNCGMAADRCATGASTYAALSASSATVSEGNPRAS